jgi:hypothetical protein
MRFRRTFDREIQYAAVGMCEKEFRRELFPTLRGHLRIVCVPNEHGTTLRFARRCRCKSPIQDGIAVNPARTRCSTNRIQRRQDSGRAYRAHKYTGIVHLSWCDFSSKVLTRRVPVDPSVAPRRWQSSRARANTSKKRCNGVGPPRRRAQRKGYVRACTRNMYIITG